jgi:hypothetical protein
MSRVVSVGDSEEVAVDYTVTEGCFSTREEALAEIAARGWHAVEYSVPAEETELHWHDYDAVVFVLDGISRTVFEDGRVTEGGPGARIDQPSRVLHRSGSSAFKAVFGFSVRLEDMSQPIVKPASDLQDQLLPMPDEAGGVSRLQRSSLDPLALSSQPRA